MKNIFTSIMIMLSIAVYAQQAPRQNLAALSNADTYQWNKPGASKDDLQKGSDKDGFVKDGLISPVSIQILAGSQGIGADVKYGFLPRLSGRFGFGIIPVTVNNLFRFSSFATADQLSAKFTNLHLLADYSPFNSSRFRIVGGAAYIVKGDANVIISPTGSYQFGNSTITKDQIGELSAAVTWKGVAPYLGVALFKSFPNRLFNMNVDIGTYYLSSPGTSLTGTKMLSDNGSQEPQFNKNMQGYRWLPVIQLNFNFRIK